MKMNETQATLNILRREYDWLVANDQGFMQTGWLLLNRQWTTWGAIIEGPTDVIEQIRTALDRTFQVM
jgi:hypothetical protein